MRVQGEIVSIGLPGGKLVGSPGDGWRVIFRYDCPCGAIHDSQAFNVWPTGDHQTDTVKHACPATNKSNEIELAKPN